MAYTIPVAALVLDHQAAALAINEPSDYFDNDRNDREDGLEKLELLTGAPVQCFASEDYSVFYVGLYVDSDWCIEINSNLIASAAKIKSANSHPLIQSAKLAVVSQFN